MKTVIELVHVYGLEGNEKFIKGNLERDGALLASFVQWHNGCYSFLVTREAQEHE